MPIPKDIPVAFQRPALPIPAEVAVRAGVSRNDLRGPRWQRITYGYYVPAGQQRSGGLDLLGTVLAELGDAVISCRTAAALWLRESQAANPLHVTVPRVCSPAKRPWLRAYRADLPESDRARVAGLAATTPIRTAFDCARLLPLGDAVAEVDALLHAGLVNLAQLTRYVHQHPRMKGLPQARRVLALCDARAESRMESRLRVLLVLAGLPRPEVNVNLYDADGHFLARVDLYWPQARLVLEYEGDYHRERGQYLADLDRRDALERAGYRVRHATARDVYWRQAALIALIRGDLAVAA